MSAKPLKIGLLGFGTVGSGVVRILEENRQILEERAGCPLVLKKIADPDTKRERQVKYDPSILTAKAEDILNDPEIEVVIEAIGGTDPAEHYVSQALQKGKHVITSNKELLAKFGPVLYATAKKHQVNLFCEASVAGGIPIIHTLKRAVGANDLRRIYGIINGTTNYVLSWMHEKKADFAPALAEAQKLGFAEADPADDVSGKDAAYKIVILTAMAFGTWLSPNDIYREGIEKVTVRDIVYAQELGYVIKLIALAERAGEGICLRVHPMFLPKNHPLAAVGRHYNAVMVDGNAVGELMFHGAGAGMMATGSAIVSDLIEIARFFRDKPEEILDFSRPLVSKSIRQSVNQYYLRFLAVDQVGVLEAVAGCFAKHKVSIASVIQKAVVAKDAEIVLITHDVSEEQLQEAAAALQKLPQVKELANLIRLWRG